MLGQLLSQLASGYGAYQGGRSAQAAAIEEREIKREERSRRSALDQALLDLREAQTERAQRPDEPEKPPIIGYGTRDWQTYKDRRTELGVGRADEEQDPLIGLGTRDWKEYLRRRQEAGIGAGGEDDEDPDAEFKEAETNEKARQEVARFGGDVDRALRAWAARVQLGHPEAKQMFLAISKLRDQRGRPAGGGAMFSPGQMDAALQGATRR